MTPCFIFATGIVYRHRLAVSDQVSDEMLTPPYRGVPRIVLPRRSDRAGIDPSSPLEPRSGSTG